MSAIVTIEANPTYIQAGSSTLLTGYVEYDGTPMDGLRVDLRYSDTDAFFEVVYTDSTGHYSTNWTPPADRYDTSFQIYAFALMYAGYPSTPITISVSTQPILAIDLSADKLSGNAPLDVNFTCSMQAGFPPYSWELDFGDGNKLFGSLSEAGSFVESHTYTSVGTFTAVLTVTDAMGVMTKMKNISIGMISTMIFPLLAMVFGAGLIYISNRLQTACNVILLSRNFCLVLICFQII